MEFIMKHKLRLIPFMAMPVAYICVLGLGLSGDGDVLGFAMCLSWLPIAICVLYIIATQKESPLFAEIGTVLHIIFMCAVGLSYYVTFYEFLRFNGFVNRALRYRVGSVVLIFCMIFVLIMFMRCWKDTAAREKKE